MSVRLTLRSSMQAFRAAQAQPAPFTALGAAKLPMRPQALAQRSLLNPNTGSNASIQKRTFQLVAHNPRKVSLLASPELIGNQAQELTKIAQGLTQPHAPIAATLNTEEASHFKIDPSKLTLERVEFTEEKESTEVAQSEPLTVIVKVPKEKTYLQKAVSVIAYVLLASTKTTQFVNKKIGQLMSRVIGHHTEDRESFNIDDFRIKDSERSFYESNGENLLFNFKS